VNFKRRLHNYNVSIYFNKQCLKRRLASYVKIEIPNTSLAHRYTQKKIPSRLIKDYFVQFLIVVTCIALYM